MNWNRKDNVSGGESTQWPSLAELHWKHIARCGICWHSLRAPATCDAILTISTAVTLTIASISLHWLRLNVHLSAAQSLSFSFSFPFQTLSHSIPTQLAANDVLMFGTICCSLFDHTASAPDERRLPSLSPLCWLIHFGFLPTLLICAYSQRTERVLCQGSISVCWCTLLSALLLQLAKFTARTVQQQSILIPTVTSTETTATTSLINRL